MGKPTGFMEYKRRQAENVAPEERIKSFDEFHMHLSDEEQKKQAARCMDCGVPFCHTGTIINNMVSGCPLNNLIPEFNDMIYRNLWENAYQRLIKTNPFPEFTGRVCPAPCEGACTDGLNGDPVTIKCNEKSIIDKAFDKGWVKPEVPSMRTDKKIAVIGSGPSGLSAAYYLNGYGHNVCVYERADHAGGLLMYGIPNMKLDKSVVQRRIDILEQSGIEFKYNIEVGKDISLDELKADYDAVVLCCGATLPRDLAVTNRENVKGIYFAVDFLKAATQRLVNGEAPGAEELDAKDKNVVVIGGGDTGTDCVATSIRQGCKNVIQLEIMPELPKERAENNPWPEFPRVLKVDYGQEEAIHLYGKDPRNYEMMTTEVIGDDKGQIKEIKAVKVKWEKSNGRFIPKPIEGSEKIFKADIVLIAMGFVGPEKTIIDQSKIKCDARGNVIGKNYKTNGSKTFVAGDMRKGQSLVVWAIKEGCEAAKSVNSWLGEQV